MYYDYTRLFNVMITNQETLINKLDSYTILVSCFFFSFIIFFIYYFIRHMISRR